MGQWRFSKGQKITKIKVSSMSQWVVRYLIIRSVWIGKDKAVLHSFTPKNVVYKMFKIKYQAKAIILQKKA